MAARRDAAILLPGIVMPAALAYADLIDQLAGRDQSSGRVRPIAKELEVYATPEPPPGYELATEVEGVLRLADEQGLERFHLVGYSGGGAVALSLAATHPERLLSLCLSEPAWAGWSGLEPEERALQRRFRELRDGGRPDAELMRAFMLMQLRPGVEPPAPPEGAPPPWMGIRPAGIRALTEAFERTDIELDRLGELRAPALLCLGELSNPDHWEHMARRLSTAIPSLEVERWPGLHHFAPPHRMEPERFAASLRSLWERSRSGP